MFASTDPNWLGLSSAFPVTTLTRTGGIVLGASVGVIWGMCQMALPVAVQRKIK
jgi:hypothetical protein